EFVPSLAPQSIKRIEELESVTVRVRAPEGQAVEEVMSWLNANVIDAAREAGLIDRTMRVRLEGTAAKLDEVRASLFGVAPARGEGRLASAANVVSIVVVVAGLAAGCVVLVRQLRRRDTGSGLYGLAGLLALSLVLGGVVLVFGHNPQFVQARF